MMDEVTKAREWFRKRFASGQINAYGCEVPETLTAYAAERVAEVQAEVQAERDALALQLAQAREALWLFDTSEADWYVHDAVVHARKVLAAPAPRADVVAAAVALAEAWCHWLDGSDKQAYEERLALMNAAEKTYRAAKDAANA